MPTVLFDDNFDDKEKVILAKTFKTNCKHLNIDGADCTVTIRREFNQRKNKQGWMTRIGADHFLVMLNSNGFNLFEGISILGHEVVHIAQYLRGDLTDDAANCIWRGQHFPAFLCELIYQELPWEREAFELQPKLHKHAIDALPRAEQKHVAKVSRHAFEP